MGLLPDVKNFVNKVNSEGAHFDWNAVARAMPLGASKTVHQLVLPQGVVKVKVFDVAGEENKLKRLFIHIPGSSFVQYCRDAHDYACSAIALQSGLRVIMIEPKIAQAPYQVNDVVGVVRSLIVDSHRWNVNSASVALSGYSSGANLALSAWLDLRDQGFSDLDAITHLLLLSGTYDLTMSALDPSQQLYTQRYRSYEQHDIFADAIFDRMYDIYLPQGMKREHPFVSPYFRDLSGLPAVDLVVAEYDGVRHQTHQLADKLAFNQQAHQLTIVPGKTHSFFIAEALMYCGVDPADLVVSLLTQRAAVMPSGV